MPPNRLSALRHNGGLILLRLGAAVSGMAKQAAEIARLRCELERARQERDISKNDRGLSVRLRAEKRAAL